MAESERKRLVCPCGEYLRADSEDSLVEKALAHLREEHPELAEAYTREHVLALAY